MVQIRNEDVIQFEEIRSDLALERTLIIDSTERLIEPVITEYLPFIIQFQEQGLENKSPAFERELVDSIQVEPGEAFSLTLPRIVDAEDDEVTVKLKVDGEYTKEVDGSGDDCQGQLSCHIQLIRDLMMVEIFFPPDYLVDASNIGQNPQTLDGTP